MSEKITCRSCGSLNCKIKYCRPFMCNTEGEYHFTCQDCKRDFFAGRKKFKDMKEYERI